MSDLRPISGVPGLSSAAGPGVGACRPSPSGRSGLPALGRRARCTDDVRGMSSWSRQLLTGLAPAAATAIPADQVETAGRFVQPALELDDDSAAEASARKRALDDAMAKARQLAGAAGRYLGQFRVISESTGATPFETPVLAEQAPRSQLAIAPGEVATTVQLTLTVDPA